MSRKSSLAAAIIACLSASQVEAASPNHFLHEQTERARVGGYVGVTLSLMRMGKTQQVPSLRLGLGPRYSGGWNSPAVTDVRRSPLELGFSAEARPRLYIGGRRLSVAGRDGGWGTEETLLAVAGVAAVLLLATQLGDSGDNDDEQCMIEPELCD